MVNVFYIIPVFIFVVIISGCTQTEFYEEIEQLKDDLNNTENQTIAEINKTYKNTTIVEIGNNTKNEIITVLNPESIDECPEKAKLVIENKNLTPVQSCSQEEKLYDGHIVHIVEIYYGKGYIVEKGGSCPQDCAYPSFYGVVEDDEILDLDYKTSPSNNLIWKICGYESELIKLSDSKFSWKYIFSNDHGYVVWLKDAYEWDTTHLVDNAKYDSYMNCTEWTNDICTHSKGVNKETVIKNRAYELLDEMGIDTNHVQHVFNRKGVGVDCLNNTVVGVVELLDNINYCEHKFHLNMDGSSDNYLGCTTINHVFAFIQSVKKQVLVGEYVNISVNVFPSLTEICDPKLTIFYEKDGKYGNVLAESEEQSIGCKENTEFFLAKTVKFDEKGEYRVYAHINNIGTQNEVIVKVV